MARRGRMCQSFLSIDADLAGSVILVDGFLLQKHVQATLALRQWVPGDPAEQKHVLHTRKRWDQGFAFFSGKETALQLDQVIHRIHTCL
jgi:hypothetical protein